MRSPHFGVKPRGPTCCVNFSTDTQHLGGFSSPVENPLGSKGGKSASEHGSVERCDSLRISTPSGYGHGPTSLFISRSFLDHRLC